MPGQPSHRHLGHVAPNSNLCSPLSLSTMWFQRWRDRDNLEPFFVAGRRMGFESFELSHILSAAAVASAAGHPIAAVHHPCPRPPVEPIPSLTSLSAEERQAAGDLLVKTVESAAELGASWVVFHLGQAPDPGGDLARAVFEVRSRYQAGRQRPSQRLPGTPHNTPEDPLPQAPHEPPHDPPEDPLPHAPHDPPHNPPEDSLPDAPHDPPHYPPSDPPRDVSPLAPAGASAQPKSQLDLASAVRSAEARVLPQALSAIAPAASLAAEHGIRLCWETGESPLDLPTVDGARELLGAANLWPWLDTGHVSLRGSLGFGGLAEWTQAVGATWAGAHIHDALGLRDHLVPGAGMVDFGHVATILADAARTSGSPVCCTLEIDWYWDPDEITEGVDYLRSEGFR